MAPSLADLRRFAVARSLFPPTTLKRALNKLGFVQADPIRAPARAQDLTLRHRVKGYRAGDLERRYASLGIEEDVFVNYGFVPSAVYALMHPRADMSHWPPGRRKQVAGAAGVRARARHGASARGGCPLLSRHGDELLGRLVERDDASARATCTTAACCAWRAARAASASMRVTRTRAAAARPALGCEPRRPHRRARRRDRRQVRAAARPRACRLS